MARVVLNNSQLRIEISHFGAELQSIRSVSDGTEWLWNGNGDWWSGRAPLLFPVVGISPKGAVSINGGHYPMGSHGFARHSRFDLKSANDKAAEFSLTASSQTKSSYPFDFLLQMRYELDGKDLVCSAKVTNSNKTPMPMQFGFHPAFNWPLPGCEGLEHQIRFPAGLPPALRRPEASGLIDEAPRALPVGQHDKAIEIVAGHYAEGAMVFQNLNHDEIIYSAGEKAVHMYLENLPDFALWQKEGAPFICLEPWQGTAPYPSQGDDLRARTNSIELAPGESRVFTMTLRFNG